MADTVDKGVLDGSFTGISFSSAVPVTGDANIMIDKGAAGDATVEVEKSFDSGVTWITASQSSDGTKAIYLANVSLNGNISEPEFGILYRLNCSAFVTGPIPYRISRSSSRTK